MSWLVKIFKGIGFIGFYLKEILISNIRVAYDALTPTHQMKPGIIAVPLDATTDTEILAFSNLMSMTPGTMSFAISEDKTQLYVHAMYVDDPEALQQEIKNEFEQRIIGVLR